MIIQFHSRVLPAIDVLSESERLSVQRVLDGLARSQQPVWENPNVKVLTFGADLIELRVPPDIRLLLARLPGEAGEPVGYQVTNVFRSSSTHEVFGE